MKKLALVIGLLLVLAAFVVPVSATQSETGNGAPSGAHYNLNLIGQNTTKASMPVDLSGNAIFVKLDSTGATIRSKILLYQGPFKVLDKNGLDGSAAFQLPYPYTSLANTTACYAVWARALGKPGGNGAKIYACEYDKTLLTETCYYPTNSIITLKRETGQSKFQDITRQLTWTSTTTPIFGEANHDYYWYYDNAGLKHAQLRFYELATCYDTGYNKY